MRDTPRVDAGALLSRKEFTALARQLERELNRLGAIADGIMKAKGSYDPSPKTDPRVTAEYERAYALIQQIAREYCPRDGRTVNGEVVKQKRVPTPREQLPQKSLNEGKP